MSTPSVQGAIELIFFLVEHKNFPMYHMLPLDLQFDIPALKF